jgi:hypothetical protein
MRGMKAQRRSLVPYPLVDGRPCPASRPRHDQSGGHLGFACGMSVALIKRGMILTG